MSQTNLKARAFLAAYRLTASITLAAKAAGIERTAHYRWLRSPIYARAFDQAQRDAAAVIEEEAIRRATEGTLEPVFYQGIRCGAVRRFSDGLAMFLLRGLNPKRYGVKAELSGPDGGPIEIIERLNAARERAREHAEAEAAKE